MGALRVPDLRRPILEHFVSAWLLRQRHALVECVETLLIQLLKLDALGIPRREDTWMCRHALAERVFEALSVIHSRLLRGGYRRQELRKDCLFVK